MDHDRGQIVEIAYADCVAGRWKHTYRRVCDQSLPLGDPERVTYSRALTKRIDWRDPGSEDWQPCQPPAGGGVRTVL